MSAGPGDRLRVLQFSASPGWGGAEKVFVDLSNALATSCDVTALVVPGTEYVHRFSDDVEVLEADRAGSRRNPLMIAEVARAIRRVEPDVVHSHAAKAAEMVHWARFLAAAPHVATKHNPRKGRIFERVPEVVCVSESVASSLRRTEGTTIIYNGIPVAPVPERTGKPAVFTIVAVGRLHGHKGFDLLVRDAAKLDFPFHLLIAGDGPEREALEALIGRLGLGDRVELLGHRDDVPELLARAHVQVVSSRTEGFGLVVAEGVHYADVVVSTPVGIAPEVLPAALVIDDMRIADKLAEVHAGWEGARSLFDRVREEWADALRIDVTAERHLALYRELVGGRSEAG